MPARPSRVRTFATLLACTCAVTAPGCGMIGGFFGGKSTPAQVVTPIGPGDAAPIGPAPSPNPGPGSGVSAADLMFDDKPDPFATPTPRNVNVFGELDGLGANVFQITGKSGFQQHTYVDEGYDSDVRVSPDGKWLLFSSTRHAEHPDLYLQPVDGLAVTQLTTDPADDAFPAYSPDGTRIAFASNRAGNWDIYVMDVTASTVEQVTRTPTQDVHPSFSPDGERLVYSSLSPRSGQWEIWTIDLRNLQRRQISYGLFPEWSPRTDKDVICFQRARQRGTRWFSAWTLEIDSRGEARNVTEVAFSSNAAIVAPTWSPDGRRLAFATVIDPTAAKPGTITGSHKGTQQDIWVVNADGTNRQRMTDGRGVNATPAWGADSRVYFISDRGGAESVWSVQVSADTNTTTAGVATDK